MKSLRETLAWGAYTFGKRDVVRYLKELQQLEWGGAADQHALQQRQLLRLLEYANTWVPYYRDLFREIGFQPGDFAANPTTFEQIPLLTKELIQQHYEKFITTAPEERAQLIKIKTGGTTGEPLWLMQSPAYRAYNTAHVYQEMTWSGWRVGQPQTWLWGHPVVGPPSRVPGWPRLKDWVANRMESNAFHITEQSMAELTQHLERQPGGVLWSYVSTLYRFAQFLEQRGRSLRLRAAYTAAEPLYDAQRAYLESVLHCPIFNSYSCVEIGSIACECEQHQGLHIRTRNCYVEVLRDGRPVPDDTAGEFVLTTLTNDGFPLIRYRIEDWGRKTARPCACGRGAPLLEVVEGRIIDHFRAPDGRLVWGAFVIPMMPLLGPIRQYQIVQQSATLLVFRIVRDGDIALEKFEDIRHAVKKVMGETMEARIEFVDSLPATPTGKHRYTVSEVK